MSYFIVIIISIALASFFKAVADTLAHHFETSVFARFKGNPFWDPALVSLAVYIPLTKYPWTAWHVANTLMIGSFLLPALKLAGQAHFTVHALLYLVAGVVFVLLFNWFYNKILRRKS